MKFDELYESIMANEGLLGGLKKLIKRVPRKDLANKAKVAAAIASPAATEIVTHDPERGHGAITATALAVKGKVSNWDTKRKNELHDKKIKRAEDEYSKQYKKDAAAEEERWQRSQR